MKASSSIGLWLAGIAGLFIAFTAEARAEKQQAGRPKVIREVRETETQTTDQKTPAPDIDKLHGEWMGRVDGVGVTLVLGPKDSALLIGGDGRWSRGTYSVDSKNHPYHLDLYWKEPVGKFKSGRFHTIMEFDESERIRIELPGEDEPRPEKFTVRSVVLTRDSRLPSGEKGHPPAEIDKTLPQIGTPDRTNKKSARVGQIIIVGNTKTATSVILKQLRLCPGEILDDQALRTAEKDLAALNSTITLVEHSENTDVKDIVVRVKEK